MQLDPADYLRLDVPHSLGATASGASFATSSGDVLDVQCFGEGAFRVRVGPNTRPDYGIVVGRAKECAVAQRLPGAWTFTSGDSMLELSGSPLRINLVWKGTTVLRSITDEHFRGFTRLPTFGRLRHGGLWSAAFALDAGEPVYGLGEKFGPLDKRGQLIHSQVEDALGVNTGLAYKNTPFAWGPGHGRGAWGTFVNTPGMVTHGVGHPDWSHRSYSLMVEDEALDLFVFAGDTPAAIIDRYTKLTGRPGVVPPWSLGLWVSRAYYRTPEEALAVAAKLRERRIPADVLTLEDAGDFRDRCPGRDRDHFAGHHVAGATRVRLDVLRRRAVGGEQARPPRVAALGMVGADLAPIEQVALAHQADEAAVRDDGHGADVPLEEQRGDVLHRGFGPHADRGGGHDVSGFHGFSPCLDDRPDRASSKTKLNVPLREFSSWNAATRGVIQ